MGCRSMSNSFQVGDVFPMRSWGLRPLFFVVLVFLLMSPSAWAVCQTFTSTDGWYSGESCNVMTCSGNLVQEGHSLVCTTQWHNGSAGHCPSASITAKYNCGEASKNGRCGCQGTITCCSNQCEVDSLNCNGTWYPNQCKCIGDECGDQRAACESLGGRFVGTTDITEECCVGSCNLCESPQSVAKYERTVTTPCCNAGFAPPPMERMCFGNHLGSGCGVSVSDYCTTDNPCYCLEPGDEGFLTARAMYCNNDQSSSSSGGGSSSSGGGSSSSGGGSSSSGGGSSSSGGNGEDWEYDYRDSLHKIIVNTGATVEGVRELVFCFTLGNCKTDLTTTNALLRNNIHVDSLIYEFIKDRMDSNIKLDQRQVDILQMIAQNGLPGDSTLWEKTDSSTAAIVNAFGESVDSTRLFYGPSC